MGNFVVPLLLITSIASLACVAGFAVAYLRAVSPSTHARKSSPTPAPTPASDGRLAKLEQEMAELQSTLASLTTTLRRISSREWKKDQRERAAADQTTAPPPHGASKAQLRAFYGTGPRPVPDTEE